MSTSQRYAAWPEAARRLAEKAEARHGGLSRFQALRSVRVSLDDLGGLLPFMKGLDSTFPRPATIEVFPHEDRVVFGDYPAAGQRGLFDGSNVRLVEDAAGARVVREGLHHRSTFTGVRKLRRWDALDALYFFGCATRTYFTMPFLLSRLGFLGLSTLRDRGQELSGITVEFPATYESHGTRQTFYFDASGLLRRHDYLAEIVGGWATGAHYSDDYVESDGLQVGTRRTVVMRLGTQRTPLPVLHARFGSVTTT